MKKILGLFVLCFLISGCSSEANSAAEEKVTVNIEKREGIAYANGEKKPFTGEFQGYYRNGYKKAEIHFKNGKQHGMARMWHENGNLSHEANFYDGKLEGMATEWYANGEKNKDRFFRNGKLIGSSD